MSRAVTFPMPERLVVIGDLNGDDDALAMMLRALHITSPRGAFCAEGVHLVQLGDVVNRGSGCRSALERLRRLGGEAPGCGSRVTVLLGNHECMVTLGNLAWCAPEELLDFATPEERMAFEVKRSHATYALLAEAQQGGGTWPVAGKLRAWEEANAPGLEAYREAMGPHGEHGRFLRSLPVAVRVGRVLLTHGGLAPRFAASGLDDLDEELQRTWILEPEVESDLPAMSFLLSDDGPLWNRRFALGEGKRLEDDLATTLRHVDASAMVVGHTRTDQMPGGQRGLPAVRFGGRLLCADVGIGSSGGAAAALIIEGEEVWAWRPEQPYLPLCRLPSLLGDEPVALER